MRRKIPAKTIAAARSPVTKPIPPSIFEGGIFKIFPDPSFKPINLQVECREDTRDTCVLEEVMDPRMVRDGRDGTTVSKM